MPPVSRAFPPAGDAVPAWQHWLDTPAGHYLSRWLEQALAAAVADVFGYHAVQLGLLRIDALAANRMPDRLRVATAAGAIAGRGARADLVAALPQLPFGNESLDLVVLPHQLEFSDDPYAVLRECERVLRPEGRLVVTGFNPHSLWGLRHAIGDGLFGAAAAHAGEFIAIPRLRDWMRVLSLELDGGRFGCYSPPLRSAAALARVGFLEAAGDRWWPILGSVYLVSAVKRVHSMRLQGPVWRMPSVVAPSAIAVAAGRHRPAMRTRAGRRNDPS